MEFKVFGKLRSEIGGCTANRLQPAAGRCKAKVRKLNMKWVALLDKNVFGFNISMHNFSLMEAL